MMKLVLVLVSGLAVAGEGLRPPQIIFIGQGKGTHLAWDLGVLEGLSEKVPAMSAGNMVLAANSGAAFVAAYFACRGIDEDAMRGARALLESFDPRLVNEDKGPKLAYLARKLLFSRGATKRQIEEGLTTFRPRNLDAALQETLQQGQCRPKLPLLLVASNANVLDNRDRQTFRNEKRLDLDTFEVKDADGSSLGRACTYFAGRELRELLLKIPGSERQCDIRPMDTVEEMRLALIATVSEPTYFPWCAEPSPERIIAADGKRPSRRFYNGGFVMPAAAQDLRRIFPEAVTIGSGRPGYDSTEAATIRGLYTARLNEVLAVQNWWLDLHMLPAPDVWKRVTGPSPSVSSRIADEWRAGKARALACLADGDSCLPKNTRRPRYHFAVPGAPHKDVPTQRGRKAVQMILNDQGE